MKNILYTIILCFLFLSSVFADYQAGVDAYDALDYSTAYKIFKTLAEEGNPRAQYRLSQMYRFDTGGVKQDLKKTLKWNHEAAEGDYSFAQVNLARIYEYGTIVTQDNKEAMKWYQRACENNHPDGCRGIADNLYGKRNATQNDYKEAFKFYHLTLELIPNFNKQFSDNWRKKSDDYISKVNHNIAKMHEEGKGVDKDLKMARELYYDNSINIDSRRNYARMLYKGEGGDIEYVKAAEIFEKDIMFIRWIPHADESFYYLGLMYSRGRGVPKDDIIGYALLNIAASYSHQYYGTGKDIRNADVEREKLAKKMEPEQISEAQKLSRQCHLLRSYESEPRNCLEIFLKEMD